MKILNMCSLPRFRNGTSQRLFLSISALCFVPGVVGCDTAHPVHEVRTDQARTTLIAALDAWKVGRTPEEMQADKPPIVVQDADWMSGQELDDYELLTDGKAVGANLSIEVRLKLLEPGGKIIEKNVWYLVGTDPALTVFRDMFHQQ